MCFCHSQWRAGPGKDVKLISRTEKAPSVKRKSSNFFPTTPPRDKRRRLNRLGLTPSRLTDEAKQIVSKKILKTKMKLPLPSCKFEKKSPKKDMTGLPMRESKILNSDFRIKKLKKIETEDQEWLDLLEAQRIEKLSNPVYIKKQADKMKRKHWRSSIAHISLALYKAKLIAPRAHATMGKIRKY